MQVNPVFAVAVLACTTAPSLTESICTFPVDASAVAVKKDEADEDRGLLAGSCADRAIAQLLPANSALAASAAPPAMSLTRIFSNLRGRVTVFPFGASTSVHTRSDIPDVGWPKGHAPTVLERSGSGAPRVRLAISFGAGSAPNTTRLASWLFKAPDVQGAGWQGSVGFVAGVVAAAPALELPGPTRAPASLPGSGRELADGGAQRSCQPLRGKGRLAMGRAARRAVSWQRGPATDRPRPPWRPGRSGAAAPGRRRLRGGVLTWSGNSLASPR